MHAYNSNFPIQKTVAEDKATGGFDLFKRAA